ncbi:MAG: hypothetical protein ACSLE6_09530 [Mycobacterium sp.]
MLIIALVLAVVGLAALVAAVVTGNEVVAWVCIAASAVGIVLLIVDAVHERRLSTRTVTTDDDADESAETTYANFDADYPADDLSETPRGGRGDEGDTDDDVDTTPTGALVKSDPDAADVHDDPAAADDDKPLR